MSQSRNAPRNNPADLRKRARRAHKEAEAAAARLGRARESLILQKAILDHPIVDSFLEANLLPFEMGRDEQGKPQLVVKMRPDYRLPPVPGARLEKVVELLEREAGWMIGKRKKAEALAAKIAIALSQDAEVGGAGDADVAEHLPLTVESADGAHVASASASASVS